MKIERLSTLAQDGLRAWAISVHHNELLFDDIGSSSEHWAWLFFQLRESKDRAEWFPKGKSNTLQVIEGYLIQEAKATLGAVE